MAVSCYRTNTLLRNDKLCYAVCPQKSVTLNISENIPKPRNKLWNFFNCTDTPNPWPKHLWVWCKFSHASLHNIHNLFRGFGIFSEIVRVTLFYGHTVQSLTPHLFTVLHPTQCCRGWSQLLLGPFDQPTLSDAQVEQLFNRHIRFLERQERQVPNLELWRRQRRRRGHAGQVGTRHGVMLQLHFKRQLNPHAISQHWFWILSLLIICKFKWVGVGNTPNNFCQSAFTVSFGKWSINEQGLVQNKFTVSKPGVMGYGFADCKCIVFVSTEDWPSCLLSVFSF